MYPWLWFWAPQIHFPLSGSLAQNIEPNTTWFSDLIKAPAGDARIEEKAFSVASYGKQLGQITEVLLELTKNSELTSPQATQSLVSLRRIKASIDAIKEAEYESSATRLIAELSAARERGGAHYARLVEQLRPLLAEASAHPFQERA